MSEVLNVEKLFGENVFTLGKMQERLPKKAFAEVKRVMEHGGELDNALRHFPPAVCVPHLKREVIRYGISLPLRF